MLMYYNILHFQSCFCKDVNIKTLKLLNICKSACLGMGDMDKVQGKIL